MKKSERKRNGLLAAAFLLMVSLMFLSSWTNAYAVKEGASGIIVKAPALLIGVLIVVIVGILLVIVTENKRY